MTAFYKINNWSHYQHQKRPDRNMIWAKLYANLMTSETWIMADDATKLLITILIMIACDKDGFIPNNPVYIKKRASLDHMPNLQPLIDSGFIIEALKDCDTNVKVPLAKSKRIASEKLADRYQSASLEQNRTEQNRTEDKLKLHTHNPRDMIFEINDDDPCPPGFVDVILKDNISVFCDVDVSSKKDTDTGKFVPKEEQLEYRQSVLWTTAYSGKLKLPQGARIDDFYEKWISKWEASNCPRFDNPAGALVGFIKKGLRKND